MVRSHWPGHCLSCYLLPSGEHVCLFSNTINLFSDDLVVQCHCDLIEHDARNVTGGIAYFEFLQMCAVLHSELLDMRLLSTLGGSFSRIQHLVKLSIVRTAIETHNMIFAILICIHSFISDSRPEFDTDSRPCGPCAPADRHIARQPGAGCVAKH